MIRRHYYLHAYDRHMTTSNLVALLELEPANEGVVEIIARLRKCRRDERCELLCCPRCGPRRQAREGYKSLNKLRRRVGGWPEPDSISWVMIGGLRVELEAIDISRPWNYFRKKLRNVRGRYLQQVALHGFVDVSLGGRIHFHGWIYHPPLMRDQLRCILEGHFGGDNDIYLSGLHMDQPTAANLDRTIQYSLERRPRLPHARAEFDDRQLPRLMGLRLLAFNLLLRRGYVGSRVSLGMRASRDRRNAPLPPIVVRQPKGRRPRTDWYWKNVLSRRDAARARKRPI